MNWLPPTRRFFMGTRHQVQSRSGRSVGEALEGTFMAGIVSEGRKPCQPRVHAPSDEAKAKIFFPPAVRRFKIVV